MSKEVQEYSSLFHPPVSNPPYTSFPGWGQARALCGGGGETVGEGDSQQGGEVREEAGDFARLDPAGPGGQKEFGLYSQTGVFTPGLVRSDLPRTKVKLLGGGRPCTAGSDKEPRPSCVGTGVRRGGVVKGALCKGLGSCRWNPAWQLAVPQGVLPGRSAAHPSRKGGCPGD